MIVTRIISGLGNQMFQYAAGYALAARHGTGLLLDLDFYQGDKFRRYELGRFNITGRPIGPRDRFRIHLGDTEPRGKRIGLLRHLPLKRYPVVRDPLAGSAAAPLTAPDGSLLAGYWQNENYFKHVRDRIVGELTFKDGPDAENAAMLEKIGSGPSVCVHVRRGDYTTGKEVVAALDRDYYIRALAWMNDRVPGARVFVFSDEPDWARENLPLPAGAVFVTHNTGKNDPEDLRLMTHCRHFVIANSTFSWWGAWLSNHPGKKVVAPARWFRVPHGDEDGIVPADWTRI